MPRQVRVLDSFRVDHSSLLSAPVMRYPQVLVYETDGLFAGLLRRADQSREWALREPRRLESCLRLLRRGAPSVLVLKLGHDLERELRLLERVVRQFPETAP